MRPWHKIFLYRYFHFLRGWKWFRKWYGGVWYLRSSKHVTGLWYAVDLSFYSEVTHETERYATIGVNKVDFEKLIKLLLKKQKQNTKYQKPNELYGMSFNRMASIAFVYFPLQDFNDTFQALKDIMVVRHLGYNMLEEEIYTIHTP
jgi:hypothetical protein